VTSPLLESDVTVFSSPQVVSPANTIANIQKSKTGKMKSAFRHQTLLEWIEEKNPTDAA